jgi:hypothetical protein
VRTLILEPSSVGLDELLERRRRSGLDRLDEIWEGVRHVVPAPSGEHADIGQQLAVILDGCARGGGLGCGSGARPHVPSLAPHGNPSGSPPRRGFSQRSECLVIAPNATLARR